MTLHTSLLLVTSYTQWPHLSAMLFTRLRASNGDYQTYVGTPVYLPSICYGPKFLLISNIMAFSRRKLKSSYRAVGSQDIMTMPTCPCAGVEVQVPDLATTTSPDQ